MDHHTDIHLTAQPDQTRRAQPPTKRLFGLAAMGVGALIALAACGNADAVGPQAHNVPKSGRGSPTLLAASASKNFAAQTARIHLQLTGGAAGQRLDVDGAGVIDFAGKRLRMTLSVPGIAALGGTVEERQIDSVSYLRLPDWLGTERWIRFDGNTGTYDTKVFGPNGFQILASATQDPTQLLSSLQSVSRNVTEVGTEDIRGVPTVHYHAELDLTKTTHATGADTTGVQRAQRQLKTLTGKDTTPVDVYIDNDGLTRRFAVPLTQKYGRSLTTTVDFYDFGNTDAETISAPSSDDLISLPALP